MCDPVSAIVGGAMFAGTQIYSHNQGIKAKRQVEEQLRAAQEETNRIMEQNRADADAERLRLDKDLKDQETLRLEKEEYDKKAAQLDQDARERDEASRISQQIRRQKRPKGSEYDTIIGLTEEDETLGKTLLGR